MNTSDLISVFAVVFSAILAVFITKILEKRVQIRNDRMSVFKVLSTCHFADLSKDKIEAINLVEIVFYDCENVIKAYREYREILNTSNVTVDKLQEKYLKLLEAMAKELGYKKVSWDILKNTYKPDGVYNSENEEREFKELQLRLLRASVYNLNQNQVNSEVNTVDK